MNKRYRTVAKTSPFCSQMEIEVHYLMEYPADGNLLRERSFSSMQTKLDRVTVEVIATKLKCVYNQRRTYSRDVYMIFFIL